MNDIFRGLVSICRKEFLHIIRDRGTLPLRSSFQGFNYYSLASP